MTTAPIQEWGFPGPGLPFLGSFNRTDGGQIN